MRLSVIPKDPGYRAYRGAHRRGAVAVVTVDGIKVRHCRTADTKRGIAVVADLHDDGGLQLNRGRDTVKQKVLAGHVAIAFVRKGL